MPLFYFDVHDGVNDVDTEGTELPDWDTARREAIRRSGRLLDNHAERLKLGDLWSMEVKDATGLILFRLDFNVTVSPALRLDLSLDGKIA